MGIRLHCPNGHKVHVKSFLAGRRGVCPHCGAKFDIPKAGADVSTDDAGADEIAVVPSVESPAESPSPKSMAAGDIPAAGSASPAAASTPQASGEIWYLRHPLHGHFGPTNWETLRRWAAEERISAESLIWREGWPDWQPAAALLPSLTSSESAVAAPRHRDPLDLDALAAAGAVGGLGGHPFGAAAQRMAARRKNALTMRVVSIVLVAAVTVLACVLLFVLMR
jgi:hypothetical protein